MANDFAIEELTKKRKALITEQQKNWGEYQKQISQLENAIESLSGKRIWEFPEELKYDDESPDYIKGTEDGI